MEVLLDWVFFFFFFFAGYSMSYYAVKTIAFRVWNKYGLEIVTSMANDFMVFKFKTEEGLLKIIDKGPWMFGGKYIIVHQWHPHFVFDEKIHQDTLVDMAPWIVISSMVQEGIEYGGKHDG